MLPKATDVLTLRRYLLGQLPQDEQEALELWLLTESEAYDLVAAAEDDLIDDSILGRLGRPEEELFQSYFLAAPERQRKLHFAKAFRNLLETQHVPEPAKALSLWEQAASFFRYPALATATAALLVAVIAGGAWTVRLQTRLNSARSQMNQVEQERQNLARELDETRAQNGRIAGQLSRLEKMITELESASTTAALTTLNLFPGVRTRSAGDATPTATITSKIRLIRFSLTLPESNYSSFRVVLADDGDGEVWRGEQVTPQAAPQGNVVVLTVPTEKLIDGDYSLKLLSSIDRAAPETLANYYFRVVHRP
jgi:hypothetical protein